MSHYEDRHLDFVLQHWQEGKFDTQKAIERFNATCRRKQQKSRLRWFHAVSAVAAAAVLVIGLFALRQQTGWTELEAGRTAQSWTLPDGTQVTLAPGSMLSYKLKGSRDVKMEGKVFFDVARDESRPFEIKADGAFVRVLGTEFQVDDRAAGRDGKKKVEVYVQSGKVLFAKSERAEGVVLTAGMSAALKEGEKMPEQDAIADVNAIAWNRGSFIFDQTPLKQVLDELSAYYGVSFAATDLDRKLSGEFMTDDLDLILELIESALDVTIIKKQ